MAKRKPLVSICVPVFNEEENLGPLFTRLVSIATRMKSKCDIEVIFSDNQSVDATWEIVCNLAKLDKRVRGIQLSANVGVQKSLLANYIHARGDVVFQIDADLQDPPELLEEFFAHWEQGYKVVYGIRASRSEGKILNTFRSLGYWFIDRASSTGIPRDVGDFALMDRKVIENLIQIAGPKPYLRGAIATMGFSHIGVPFKRDLRKFGKSKFNTAKLIKLGLAGVLNYSLMPLRLATYSGLIILAATTFLAGFYGISQILNPSSPQGFTTLILVILFGIGFNALLLGIIGEYILRLNFLMRPQPVARVVKTINFKANEIKL